MTGQALVSTVRRENLAAPADLLEPVHGVRAHEAGTASGNNSFVSRLRLLDCDWSRVSGSS